MTGDAENETDVTTLVQCDDCCAVIPIVVRATGERRPMGTGGECPVGEHAFRFRGERITPGRNDDSPDTGDFERLRARSFSSESDATRPKDA